jgi:hypothetical protein
MLIEAEFIIADVDLTYDLAGHLDYKKARRLSE